MSTAQLAEPMTNEAEAPAAAPAPKPPAARPADAPPAAETTSAKKLGYSSFGVSLGVHCMALLALGMIHQAVVQSTAPVAMESAYEEDLSREAFERVLSDDRRVATELNPSNEGSSSVAVEINDQIASGGGGGGTGGGGGGGTGGNGSAGGGVGKILASGSKFRDVAMRVGIGDVVGPGTGALGDELDDRKGGAGGGIKGEGTQMVGGYGAALGLVTTELIRLLRSEQVMCVWLFDESESMKDDQKEIRENFHKVYEELGLVTKSDKEFSKKKNQEILLTSVIGFGDKYHPITPKPTADVKEIKDSIDKIDIDQSGLENTCAAIMKAIDDHRVLAQKQKRKLVLIVVTDESGDDGDKVELALDAAKKAHAPIYIMGREAIFGYKYARVRWMDPKYKLWHWLPILRGPETPFRECLQWDGLHARWDAFSSGFGPYEQVRLAKETGGIFFVLPGEEQDLTGVGANEKRKFDALDMKEYEPQINSRREYAQQVTQSKFRATISECIEIMDPEKDKELNISEHHYPTEINKFKSQASREVVRAARSMEGLNRVIPLLEKIKPLRAKEDSERWRAHYDLILAQCYAYRVRLFQFLLAMDDHVRKDPKVSKPNYNEWNVRRTPKMLEPDEDQFKALKAAFKLKSTRAEYLEELKDQEKNARELFEFVMIEHPRTPWARRAQFEISMGFGIDFVDGFWSPNYNNLDIKVPKF